MQLTDEQKTSVSNLLDELRTVLDLKTWECPEEDCDHCLDVDDWGDVSTNGNPICTKCGADMQLIIPTPK